MRKLIILLAAIVVSVSAYAAPPTTESIDALLTVTKTESVIDSMMGSIDTLMKQALAENMKGERLTPAQQRYIDSMPAKFAQVMREEMSWAKMRPLYVQIYQESFTQEEIDGLIAFYKSPTGAAFVEKMPLVMQKSMSVMQSRMGPLMERMTAMIEEAAAEAKSGK